MLMTSGLSVGRRRLFTAILALLGAFAMAAGCGKPEFNYVANTDEKTYFKVPSEWTMIDGSPVFATLQQVNPESAAAQKISQITWATVYDSSSRPLTSHVTTFYSTKDPVVYSAILHVPRQVQGGISLDVLRNFLFPLFPVTDVYRKAAEDMGSPLTGFELLADEVLSPKPGMRGVRVVYNYEMPTTDVDTFDLTVYTNNDASIVYLLLIRCTARCYRERAAELDGVATSFTVGSQP
jgi:hypothetical protein